MNVREEVCDGYSLLAVEGDVDVSNALQLRDALGTILTRGGRVLVDLQGVPFVDSSGIGIFVAAHRLADQHGAVMVLAAPTDEVRQVLAMTRTDRLLRVVDTADAGYIELGVV